MEWGSNVSQLQKGWGTKEGEKGERRKGAWGSWLCRLVSKGVLDSIQGYDK
jgi:hypothetical protein